MVSKSRSPARRSTRQSPSRNISKSPAKKPASRSKSPARKAAASTSPRGGSKAQTQKQAAAKSKSRSSSRSRAKKEEPKQEPAPPARGKVLREPYYSADTTPSKKALDAYEFRSKPSAEEPRYQRLHTQPTEREGQAYLRRPVQQGMAGRPAPQMKKKLITRAQFDAFTNRISANVRHFAPLYSFVLLLLLVFGTIYYTGYKVSQVIKHFQNQMQGYVGSLTNYTTTYFQGQEAKNRDE